MIRKLLPLLLALVLVSCGNAGPSSARSSTLYRILDRGTLIVGLEAEFPPFEYVKDGEIVGFDVDMANLIADELGVELKIEDRAFTALSGELLTGKIDIVISGMTATPDRAKKVTFTNSYFQTGLCLLLHRGTTDDVESVEDLNDAKYKIVAKSGTTGQFAAERMLSKAELYTLPKEGTCALEVSDGKADAFVYDMYSLIENHRRFPKTTRVILKPFTYEPYAMAIRKGDFDWWNWLNLFLDHVKKDGRLAAIHRKHLGE